MKTRIENWQSRSGAMQFRALAVALLVIPLSLLPVLAGAVETDRITVEDPATSVVKFKVTSDGNVTAASYTGNGAGLTNVPHWKGTWSAAVAYAKDECVAYGGSSYIALAASTNAQPDTSPASWTVLAQRGPAGTSGATGPQGPIGLIGPAGPQGTAGSPDMQAQVLSKIATQTNGAVLAMQQDPAESSSSVKFAISDSTGNRKMQITAAGNALIGASNSLLITPSPLEVHGVPYMIRDLTGTIPNAQSAIKIGLGGTAAYKAGAGPSFLFFTNNGADDYIGRLSALWENDTHASGAVAFQVHATPGDNGATERMRISSAGNVGIGTTAPSQKLEVDGGIRMNTITAKTACDVTVRGTFWFTQGVGSSDDSVSVCSKIGGTYTWKVLF